MRGVRDFQGGGHRLEYGHDPRGGVLQRLEGNECDATIGAGILSGKHPHILGGRTGSD
jgi:hypothetical protein